MVKSKNSLLLRAITSVLLTIGFYGLALAIAGGLLFLVYAQFVIFETVNSRLTLFAIVGAVVIIWAILPRIDRFIPPGPQLTPSEFPLLFREIKAVADLTQQEMPRDVYLIPDVNAFVAERGGMMGIGRRRVMGIGLGLLKLLNISELKSVLAHEFGHYYGGDTALGPWIYRTRTAIIRTAVNVGHQSSLLQAPFVWYAKMFLRITNAISRQQEFSADRLSATIVGKQAATSSLAKIHRYSSAFGAFWQQEYLPVVNNGFRPSLLNGFDRFLETQNVTQKVESSYQQVLSQEKADPYDTHPSLKERLAALESLPQGEEMDDQPALSLVQDPEDLEGRILMSIAIDKEKIKTLKPLQWEDLTEIVYLPMWEKNAQSFAGALTGMTIGNLPEHAKKFPVLFLQIAANGWKLPPNVKPKDVPPQVQLQICSNVVGCALISTLRKQGWGVKTGLGEEVTLEEDGQIVKPFQVFIEMAAGKLTKETWETTCTEQGIYALNLASNQLPSQ